MDNYTVHLYQQATQTKAFLLLICVFLLLPYVTGCEFLAKNGAGAQPRTSGSPQKENSISVNVAIAKIGTTQEPLEYPGTTKPVREVSVSSQIEGRLLKLNVDVGDRVRQGQILAQIDDTLLLTAVNEAQAELAALESEVAQAQNQVSNAKARAKQAELEFEQAQIDARRLNLLYQEGAISQQEAELTQTAAATAQQNVVAAKEQISTEQKAVRAAQGRVKAQQAVVAQNRERQSYALLAAPMNSIVLEKVTEPGDLVTPGSEVLKLGDFSRVKVEIPVSDLELANIQVGQAVSVRLDAFASQSLAGEVIRILPAADLTQLKVLVEVTIPNSNGRIGSGLLARVSFAPTTPLRVVIPETALQGRRGDAGTRGRGDAERGDKGDKGDKEDKGNKEETIPDSSSSEATVFVVSGEGDKVQVKARLVRIGTRANGQVEIISGLQPGERFVTRSGKPLKDGDTVRLSVISE
ncbi:MAG: HlyD family efflux transporter periplasmic adaptor subunit [Symploca sp. SIO2E6]|nr:HlyD family efflux transporter periplasmic adaptor subunit [Symploca sp. SIO2E6]